jgi:hypothetical protein
MLPDKKIAFGVNLFGSSVRTDLSIESYLKIKKKFPDNVDLFNVQFVDETVKYREHPDFKLLRVLEQSNQDYIKTPSKKTIPMSQEVMDKLAELNYDIFCFTNDDIIISDRYIDFILNTDYDCYPASRLAIKPITSLKDEIVNEHFQVAGFDTFAFKTKWWKENRQHFPQYVIGNPCWDVHYATLCMRFGNSTLCNKWPAPTFHIIHGDDSHNPSPEKDHNFSVYWKPHKFDVDMWHNYLFDILLKRPEANYCTPHDNELELEKVYFNDTWFKNHYRSYQ